MPLEAPLPPVADRVAALNAAYRHHSASAVLERAVEDPTVGRIAMVSSFGAESVALLHLVSVIDRTIPVLFIDTRMLFPETLDYQADVADRLGLTDVQRVAARALDIAIEDRDGTLHRRDPDACCDLRKSRPLDRALEPFDAWITGRKRFQSGSRAQIEFFETDGAHRIKVNPLAYWTPQDVQDYMINNRLPRHPLVAQGYPSIGCAPCTSPVAPGEDPRAGRWRGAAKDECGIHVINGKMVRGPLPAGGAA